MKSPYQYSKIYLRPCQGRRKTLECSLDGDIWRDTGLSAKTVYDRDTSQTLGQLVDTLSMIDQIEEVELTLLYQRQKAIGRMLATQMFGSSIPAGRQHIHFVPVVSDDGSRETEDFFDLFLRIPWTLLADRNDAAAQFLALRKPVATAITLDAAPSSDGQPRFKEVKLPPYPKILLVCPSKTKPPTEGAQHCADLEKALREKYDPAGRSNRIRTVETFPDLVNCLNQTPRFSPHIIYFYGHADSEGEDTILQFDAVPAGDNGSPEESNDPRSIGEIRGILDDLVARTSFPPIIWINACKGAAAKRNSAMRLLAPIASVVITTRTLSVVSDSLQLGRLALPKIAIDGQAPPLALRDAMLQMMAGNPQMIRSARWATTFVAVQYGLWSPLGTEKREITSVESSGDIPMRLDRSGPLSRIQEYLDGALLKPTNAPHAILWHGTADDSTRVFAQRFVDFTSEAFSDWSSVNYSVELQQQAQVKLGDAQFRESVYRALNNLHPTDGVGTVQDLDLKNAMQPLNEGQPTFVTLSHGPFDETHIDMLRDYLAFWNSLFPTLKLDPGRTRVLLGLRFIREGPPVSLDTETPLFVQVPLGPVASDELIEHLQKYHPLYSVGEERIDEEVEKMIETQGTSFRKLHKALEEKLGLIKWSILTDEGEKP